MSGPWINVFSSIRESFTGAWQKNVSVDPPQTLLQFSAIYACVTGIASDIAKLRIKLVENRDGIWSEITDSKPWLKVLRKPNAYQTRIQFLRQWVVSLLLAGNTYVLKVRDGRNVVTELHVLNPGSVTTLIAPGAVFYELKLDELAGVDEVVTVPASEIIHDRLAELWHRMLGVPPIYACAAAGTMGNKIQQNSMAFFGNKAMPAGILFSERHIDQKTADELAKIWETNYGGENAGKIAVVGDGMKFEAIEMTAVNAQVAEQFKMSVEDVGRAFRYPISRLVPMTSHNQRTVDAENLAYYGETLQCIIESLELCLDEGLEFPSGIGTELDIDNLMRMDLAAQFDTINKAERFLTVDEQRFRAGYGKTKGGDQIYRQHQDHSIEALAARDDSDDPFGTKSKASAPNPQPADPNADRGNNAANVRQLLGLEAA